MPDLIRWSARLRDRRTDFRCATDPTPLLAPRGLQLKHYVGPTRKRLVKSVGFITPDGLRGLNTLSGYRRLNTPYYIKYINININIETPRRRRVGPRGAATWP